MGLVFAALFGIAAYVGVVYIVRKRWRFTDTPTSDCAHVFPGVGEVQGVVEAVDGTTASPSDGAACVGWWYSVEQETGSGKNKSWTTRERGHAVHPFVVRDGTGTVPVFLGGASVGRADEVDVLPLTLGQLRAAAHHHDELYEQSAFSAFFASNDIDEPIARYSGNWRATEHRLRVGDHVFITCDARLSPDGASVELAPADHDGSRRLFEITVGDERAALGNQASAWLAAMLALVVVIVAVTLGASSSGGPLAALGVVTAVSLALVTIGTYNRLRRAAERVRFAWSLIEVASQQRADLVPQLERVVEAAFGHERALLTSIAEARAVGARPSDDGIARADGALTASRRLVARSEATPELMTQPNVAQLAAALTLLDDRVAFGRRFYNDSVERLANRVQQFPDRLLAGRFRTQIPPLFRLTEPPKLPRVGGAP